MNFNEQKRTLRPSRIGHSFCSFFYARFFGDGGRAGWVGMAEGFCCQCYGQKLLAQTELKRWEGDPVVDVLSRPEHKPGPSSSCALCWRFASARPGTAASAQFHHFPNAPDPSVTRGGRLHFPLSGRVERRQRLCLGRFVLRLISGPCLYEPLYLCCPPSMPVVGNDTVLQQGHFHLDIAPTSPRQLPPSKIYLFLINWLRF